jgi:aminoglycoside phosphotransferase family enzyme
MPDKNMRPSTYPSFDHDTEAKLAFLAQPQAYSDRPRSVECIETHMAWVFLTDRHAFKLKKPVRYDFLDFSTVEARRQDCAREIELNRRLAADVYLEMVPLAVSAGGSLELGGSGEIVDWLVKMRRLPRERMLDWQLEHATPTAAELRPAALLLAGFYRNAQPLEVTPQTYLQDLANFIRENREALSQPTYELPTDLTTRVCDGQLEFLDKQGALVRQRVRDQRIIEGHGDLRPEHICLVDPPVIIDCLEFKREFRIVDPVDEIAFLTLECHVLGQTWAGELFLDTYSEVTEDHPEIRLFEYYKSQRAVLRAKLAAWHLRDSEVRDAGKWLSRARYYLALASDFLARALED